MKVLQLVTNHRPFFDDQVTALEGVGVESTVLEVPGSYRPDEPRSVAEYARYYPQVLAAIDDHDLVHANYGLTAPFALAATRRPVVVTFWGTDLMSEREWLCRLSRMAAGLADATILPSRRMAEALGRPYTFVPFGVDADRFRQIPRDRARDRVGWSDDETIVLFPYAPERPEKDFPRAERVVEAADADADLRTVTGVPHHEMSHYLNASDALLVTSRRESGPMVVKEAAACGVPVVSTDVGFVDDVPGTAVCSSTDELAAELDRVLEAPRPAGATLPPEWQLEATGARLRAVYERVCADRNATRSGADSLGTQLGGAT
ncbi:group 1 glycosyl transferase [Halovivax asiaticus JCM 14624]|uniref:Group 1 glycosyl transferase n=1 Tax=Halovivax asiaticus JCM 14624 TaxID=1227490 RepID=M0BKH4_9EURY|nr:glycosyltransferase [Halovivax asiaticus]ELZ10967.1 group 1 glycosyl transferase [Halovivax asiaticus JCM 14624]